MEENKVVVSRVFSVQIEKVFAAWVDAEQMKQWYSPEGMTTPDAGSDRRKDGAFHVTMQMGEQQFHVAGKYLEYDEPNKLVLTWGWKDAPSGAKPTTVMIAFKKVDGNKTEVTLTHSGFVDESDVKQHNEGWIGTYNKLEKYLG